MEGSHTLHKNDINRNHHSKTLHLLIKINNNLVKGLVDISTSMLVMYATIIHKLGIMHPMFSIEFYKTMSGVVTQTLNRIFEFFVKVRDV